MLIWLFVVEMVEKSRSDIVGNYYFVFELSWRVGNAVTGGNEKSIRGEPGVSDVVTHLIMLVTRFVVGNLTGLKMSDSSFT